MNQGRFLEHLLIGGLIQHRKFSIEARVSTLIFYDMLVRQLLVSQDIEKLNLQSSIAIAVDLT